MKVQFDGDKVFVSADSFVNLQESDTVFGNVREFCLAAAFAMVAQGFDRYDATIDSEDWNSTFPFAFKEGGRVLRVAIDWVDAPDALTKQENGCSCGSTDDHHTVDCFLGVDTKENKGK